MLGLASKSGNMAEIYKATAKFLERQQEFRKNFCKRSYYSNGNIICSFLAVAFLCRIYLPATAKAFVKFDIPLPPMTTNYVKNK